MVLLLVCSCLLYNLLHRLVCEKSLWEHSCGRASKSSCTFQNRKSVPSWWYGGIFGKAGCCGI